MPVGRNNNTQDTIKDFIGDIADSTKKAFDDILDRKGGDSDSVDWLTPGNPYQALNGLPGDVLRTVSAMSALGGVANPVAALANAANAAAGSGAANPLAALAGAAPNPLAALTGGGVGGANPLAALGQVAGGATSAVSGAADMAEGLAALPRQIAQLSELVGTLVGVLENVQGLTGAVTGGGRAPAARKGT
ncbi:hypothetical protein [Streptomyces sp. NBC_00878]|uniref:hypothetical protein n=1 Tax=Streptomyces sp. NBC_00878 TaxID=2975854 RepID=UPI00224D1EBD|nr:hypothetical protein [Streptomyces sp. NBC_00878]MCX4903572.1 hypothetical protein [Streptomyces sp. NBC_00878]